MTDKWTAISGILALGAFILTPLFFFLTTPPTVREVVLMVVAFVFGGCFAWFLAVLTSSKDKRATHISRESKLQELRAKKVRLTVDIQETIGAERTLRIQARDARRNRMDDF